MIVFVNRKFGFTMVVYLKDGIPDDRSLGGLTIFAFFSAAFGDMIKPFELEGA